MTVPVEVPADCPGQWLRLNNPAPTRSTQWIEGELWLDDARILPAVQASERPGLATP
ncbi:hypothetical protein H1235_00670 [Pseudoxanthomonas sp. NC8]|nr:hypothetical protein H1235_00670 [Pseudoxanthomonas sp. NC8]